MPSGPSMDPAPLPMHPLHGTAGRNTTHRRLGGTGHMERIKFILWGMEVNPCPYLFLIFSSS